MADKTTGELQAVEIGSLPLAPDVYDDTKIPVEQQGEAKHITGRQWKSYAVSAIQIPKGDAEDAAQRAAESAKSAAKSAEAAEYYSGKPPIIDGDKQTWWTWDAEQQAYKDTAKPSRGNLMYATFEVEPDTGNLYMYTDDEYDGPQFALTGPDLEVILEHA